ncbi:MAG: hypothetical protein HZB33_12550 [Nitrospirae bacterium]|nr:hypothetical protein [Nitrospirota bacterium]
MTQSRFFQLSLGFPVLLWCVLLAVFTLLGKGGNDNVLENLRDGYQIFVPYLFFAAAVWKLADGKTYRKLIFMAFFVPIFWGGFFTLVYMAASFIKDRTVDRWHVLFMMAFWAMVVAYLFEIVPYLILNLFKNDFRPGHTEETDDLSSRENHPAE